MESIINSTLNSLSELLHKETQALEIPMPKMVPQRLFTSDSLLLSKLQANELFDSFFSFSQISPMFEAKLLELMTLLNNYDEGIELSREACSAIGVLVMYYSSVDAVLPHGVKKVEEIQTLLTETITTLQNEFLLNPCRKTASALEQATLKAEALMSSLESNGIELSSIKDQELSYVLVLREQIKKDITFMMQVGETNDFTEYIQQ